MKELQRIGQRDAAEPGSIEAVHALRDAEEDRTLQDLRRLLHAMERVAR